ncbi:MAG: tetratricopeptide repeat protein [Cyclonatronaceae bacterium]
MEVSGVPASERRACLAEACGGDKVMYEEVLSLLAACDATGVLDKPIDHIRLLAVSAVKTGQMAGQRIGNYRIVTELGHGGMGSVYLAERADGEFMQRVALKLLHNPLATEQQVQRFRSERQILAALEHENIARLLDGGVTEQGLPYYVMELAEGLPVDEYCDKQRLTIEERLELFQDVCRAVQHAHRNLVVHRDLKPSNIFVTNDGRVKLLDFGIAKVLGNGGSVLTEGALTCPGLLPLTPAYASPEQIRGGTITTASDIYQLGVVLYELLSGYRPYKIEGRSPAEVEKTICDTDPKWPGNQLSLSNLTRNSESGEISRICGARSTGLRQLRKQLHGDAGTIVMKAMSKEPNRRYESAEQLGEDIRRFLANKPVKAHPDSRLYRARKFLRRNPVEIVAAVLIAILIAGYQITTTWHSHRTEAALEQAQRESGKSAQVVEFMLGIFEAGDPLASPGDHVTARELMQRGLDEANRLDGQPELQANMFNVIGKVYTSLGRYRDAAEVLERAVEIKRKYSGDEGTETARYMNDLAVALTRLGRYEEAHSIYRESLAILTGQFGEYHPEVANTMMLMGSWVPVTDIDTATELRQNVLEIRRSIYGDDHLLTADAYMKVGAIMRARAAPGPAIEAFGRALEIRLKELGPAHQDVAESMIFMADIYRMYNLDQKKAEVLYRDALAIQDETLGERHYARLHGLTSYATLLLENGKHGLAEELYLKNLLIRRNIYGEKHPSTAAGYGQLATGYKRMGNYELAVVNYRKSLDLWIEIMGADHVTVAGAMVGLGNVLVELHKFGEAESLLRQALQIHRKYQGVHHEALVLGAMGLLYQERGDMAVAENHYRQAINLFENAGVESHYDVVQLREKLNQLMVLRD